MSSVLPHASAIGVAVSMARAHGAAADGVGTQRSEVGCGEFGLPSAERAEADVGLRAVKDGGVGALGMT